jgi:hypothetical protein
MRRAVRVYSVLTPKFTAAHVFTTATIFRRPIITTTPMFVALIHMPILPALPLFGNDEISSSAAQTTVLALFNLPACASVFFAVVPGSDGGERCFRNRKASSQCLGFVSLKSAGFRQRHEDSEKQRNVGPHYGRRAGVFF